MRTFWNLAPNKPFVVAQLDPFFFKTVEKLTHCNDASILNLSQRRSFVVDSTVGVWLLRAHLLPLQIKKIPFYRLIYNFRWLCVHIENHWMRRNAHHWSSTSTLLVSSRRRTIESCNKAANANQDTIIMKTVWFSSEPTLTSTNTTSKFSGMRKKFMIAERSATICNELMMLW